jgi:hypothetical protein
MDDIPLWAEKLLCDLSFSRNASLLRFCLTGRCSIRYAQAKDKTDFLDYVTTVLHMSGVFWKIARLSVVSGTIPVCNLH